MKIADGFKVLKFSIENGW